MTSHANAHIGGKAARARAARNGIDVVTDLTKHRPSGGAPIASDLDLQDQYHSIVLFLEELEKKARIKFRPHLIVRREVPMDNHGSMIVPATASTTCSSDEEMKLNDEQQRQQHDDNTLIEEECCNCNLSEQNLREFTIQLIPLSINNGVDLLSLTKLDLSRNELWKLPSLESIPNIQHLNLSRNWFAELPESIADLTKLQSLNVSHNMLRSSQAALLMDRKLKLKLPDNSNDPSSYTTGMISILQSLQHLQELDLTFNQKCGHQKLFNKIQNEISSVRTIKMTINFPRPEGAFVGASAAERDPSLLRSQLEPWSTTCLRRRLVSDFGQEASSPEHSTRGDVMDQLLQLYAEELEEDDHDDHDHGGDVHASRTVIRASGILVEESLRKRMLLVLKSWKNKWTNKNLERASIKAENYMILTSPASWEPLGRKKRQKAEAKLNAHLDIWDLAVAVMASVDEEFSKKFTALAVTHNFQGSPHIDRQNIGPFWGLSLGDFEDGTGGIMVECSARVVAHVDTKNRLSEVDGRFPHWVAPYDEKKDRFSLIFYQTMGDYQKIGPAIFDPCAS